MKKRWSVRALLKGMDYMEYRLVHRPNDIPLTWQWWRVLPAGEKVSHSQFSPYPDNWLYVASFKDKVTAREYRRVRGLV